MPTFKGTKGPILVREDVEFSTETGRRIVKTFRGEKLRIFGMTPTFERDGVAYRITREGESPIYSLTAVFQDADNSNYQNVQWSLTTETLQKSIFDFPAISTELETASNPVDLKRAILNARDEGSETIIDENGGEYTEASFPESYKALRLMLRGVEYYEDEYLVLRRRRVFSSLRRGSPMRLDVTKKIFANSELGVPTNLAFTLPNLSTLPTKPNATWGWRLRGHESTAQELSCEQVHEFVLASWSTYLYELAGAPFSAFA